MDTQNTECLPTGSILLKGSIMAKFTRATANSFIRKNMINLQIKVKSSFDGMTDCVERTGQTQFVAAKPCVFNSYTQGVQGVWFVGNGRDYFTPRYNDKDVLVGFECYNSCGTFEVRASA